jgi:ABC-type polysaccharide/polyol phosphate transport system ATPase subunit
MSKQKTIDPNSGFDIILEDVTVRYQLPEEIVRTFKEYAINIFRGKNKKRSFLALDGISLNIKSGEIFGIIGKNGAGKSTLLKVISRVLIPTQGRVVTRGQVYPLLQLGAGYHPELTGRENIFLNGTLLGHTRSEIEEKYQDIIDFSEIANFINAPVRTYSSGMQARLGFAVASAWQPEILILDEVLSVGDVAFQEKCQNRMREFREHGTTTVVVSHSPQLIASLCKRALWLDKGKIVALGESEIITQKYKTEMGV